MEDIAQERGPGYRYSRRATLPLIRQLSVVPNWRNALLLALQWAAMIAACTIAIRIDRWPAYLIAGIVIGVLAGVALIGFGVFYFMANGGQSDLQSGIAKDSRPSSMYSPPPSKGDSMFSTIDNPMRGNTGKFGGNVEEL